MKKVDEDLEAMYDKKKFIPVLACTCGYDLRSYMTMYQQVNNSEGYVGILELCFAKKKCIMLTTSILPVLR